MNAFTFSLPVYWAIVLAAPGVRSCLGPLILGTVVVTVLEAFMLLAFMRVFALHVAAQLGHSQGTAVKWFLHFGEYLVKNVIPYAAPFLIAMFLHWELRRQVFGWAEDTVGKPATKLHRRDAKRSRKGRWQRR